MEANMSRKRDQHLEDKMAFSPIYVSWYFIILYSNTKLNNLFILIQTLTPFHNNYKLTWNTQLHGRHVFKKRDCKRIGCDAQYKQCLIGYSNCADNGRKDAPCLLRQTTANSLEVCYRIENNITNCKLMHYISLLTQTCSI